MTLFVRSLALATTALLVVTAMVPSIGNAAATDREPAKPAEPAGLTGEVTASSSAGDAYAPENAFDPDLGTTWQAGGTVDEWLQVDLGEPHALTGLRQTFADRDVWRFELVGSRDGQSWVTLLDHSGGLAGRTYATSVSGVYRYVRLNIAGAAHGSVPSSAELLLQGSATEVDVAAGRPVTTSSEAGGYEGRYAVDHDTSTMWGAATGELPQSLTVDLGEVRELTAVEQNFKDYDRVAFQIEGSVDNEDWTTLVERSAARGQSFRESVEGEYRYVRLTITSTEHGHWAGSTSFRVFAPLPSALPSLVNRNLATGTAATSSSLAPGFEPWYAVDSDPSTVWIARDASTPQSLTVDLGRASTLTSVRQTFRDTDTWYFLLEGSVDGSRWETVLDHRNGAHGRVFEHAIAGTYRYVRLTVTAPSDGGHWPNSEQLAAYGNGSPLTYRRWSEHSGPVMRYYPKHYRTKLTTITGQLDDLKEQGYQGIEVAAPYKGPRIPWAGLGATDNYEIDPSIGTMADFEQLIAEAHERDMTVVMFGNVGYASPQAPFWRKAQQDPASVERKWFDIIPADGPNACRAEDHRYWSELANGCYFSFWTDPHDPDGHMPAYNFANQEWRDEASRYLRFWMDKGLDGFGMDAPRAYLNISTEISNRYLTGVLNNYNAWTLPEGLQPDWENERPGDLLNGVPELRYNTIQDLYISWWGCAWPCSRIVPKILDGDPSALEDQFKASRDVINQQGGTTMLNPSWDSDIDQADGSFVWDRVQPADVRLLEMATIATSGNQFYMHNGNHLYLPHERMIPTWDASQQEKVGELLRAAGSHDALQPKGLRFRVPTNDDQKFYAFVRTDRAGGSKALVVLNYQNSAQDIDIQIGNTGIALDQTPIDLLDGGAADPITGETYSVRLPARGFAVLAVR